MVRYLWPLLLLWGVSGSVSAQLLISPTKVIFSGNEREVELTLLNSSSVRNSYRIEFVEREQDEGGGYVNRRQDKMGLSASSMIRHSPRQVTIEPGQYQRIRLYLREPGDLQVGEYRSHLLYKKLAETKVEPPKGKVAQPLGNDPNKKLDAQLEAEISFSIPVVVRHGNVSSIGKISNPTLKRGKEKLILEMQILSEGTGSVHGDVEVFMQESGSPNLRLIGKTKGISVYPEVGKRQVAMELMVDTVPAGAVVNVVYQTDRKEGFRVIDQASFRYNGQ
ncbi:MAG: molecular chaperone [Gammaproteobacteria bacterium]|nr:molecular chaperone [Gammaproteobacteria bacterium]